MCYEVYAVDTLGTRSRVSNTACITTEVIDLLPPAPPTNVLVSNVTSNSVQLTWESTDSSDNLSYLIEDNSDNAVLERVFEQRALINRLQSNADYCFSIYAVSSSGQVSGASEIVCATTRPLVEGSWQVSLRCDQSSEYAFNSPLDIGCLLYTSPSPRDKRQSRMPSSA